ncbi:tripartite tricarboxylate transporter permease [Limimaricola sp.]|uniref:tripartite tricarboxylate transporter permease n=1 Tax=Limimaricola sp. TaxID=2211665 RepID=UPI0025BCEBC9|nr:tripartite tricarboxylate transporter permease [Limimaricola sp.]
MLVSALFELAEPLRLAMLVLGVLLGLTIGVIPGIGGVFGLTVLVPLTYTLDPVSAFALLLGMSSVTTTSDTVPAVLLGVPGTVGAAATVIDGHEMAKQGRAAEALGAAYTASLIGGLFGAALLAMALPVMRPLVLFLNYGDLLAITIFGMTLVAMLSGGSQVKGLLAALMGVLVSLVGLDPYEGVERYTFGALYLWGGFPTPIVFLGLFGLSELGALMGRGKILRGQAQPEPGGLGRGARAALRNWPLVLRSSALGSLLGAVPGVGVMVIEWIAYGSAARKPGPGPAFGHGNVRGVIGPESANNAKEGGALLPTLAFGIPGSATMAILLGAFSIHGLTPGPRMLDTDAVLLVTMILSIALANLLGAAICLGLTPLLARIALVPARLLVPLALVFVLLGAFDTNKSPLDLAVLFGFGVLGILFKSAGWSRPAFALGFILGPNLERFSVLTYQISGWTWLSQPFVVVILAMTLAGLLRRLMPARNDMTKVGAAVMSSPISRDIWLTGALTVVAAAMVLGSWNLPFAAALFPRVAGAAAVLIGGGIWISEKVARRVKGAALAEGSSVSSAPNQSMAGRPNQRLVAMAVLLGALILGFGHLAGPFLFVLLTLLATPSRRPLRAVIAALAVLAIIYLVFDRLVPQTWPAPLITSLFG